MRAEPAQPRTLESVPNQPKTPLHSFRVNDTVWVAAKAKTVRDGETLGSVLRQFLDSYIANSEFSDVRATEVLDEAPTAE